MSSFGLFRKQKNQDLSEQATEDIQKSQLEQTDEIVTQGAKVEENSIKEVPVSSENQSAIAPASPEITIAGSTGSEFPSQIVGCKTYLKAIPLRNLSDLDDIKTEIQSGNILILRITPLASKSIEAVKSAVNELYAFTESIGGDIARLGEERVVICPKNIRIWREKMPAKDELLPTTVV
ncbi:MAG: cell division protein SepF [Nitrososphaerota archaeon]|jgi:SepF-like predicted cell division protein (DUF552 family)|nr:cell division protein SepF [Nitrososphaerota archaeon]